MLKALASEPRLRILRYLGDRVVAVNRIATDLGLPPSTAAMHVAELEQAGLITCELRPASRGLRKVCSRTYDEVVLGLPRGDRHARRTYELSMPVGAYSDIDVQPTCGLAGPNGLIGLMDDPASFYEPDRQAAQLVWFRAGYVEYRFPNRVPPGSADLRARRLGRGVQRGTPPRPGLAERHQRVDQRRPPRGRGPVLATSGGRGAG